MGDSWHWDEVPGRYHYKLVQSVGLWRMTSKSQPWSPRCGRWGRPSKGSSNNWPTCNNSNRKSRHHHGWTWRYRNLKDNLPRNMSAGCGRSRLSAIGQPTGHYQGSTNLQGRLHPPPWKKGIWDPPTPCSCLLSLLPSASLRSYVATSWRCSWRQSEANGFVVTNVFGLALGRHSHRSWDFYRQLHSFTFGLVNFLLLNEICQDSGKALVGTEPKIHSFIPFIPRVLVFVHNFFQEDALAHLEPVLNVKAPF